MIRVLLFTNLKLIAIWPFIFSLAFFFSLSPCLVNTFFRCLLCLVVGGLSSGHYPQRGVLGRIRILVKPLLPFEPQVQIFIQNLYERNCPTFHFNLNNVSEGFWAFAQPGGLW